MASLLIRDLDTVVTCDDADSVLRHVDLYCEDGRIRAISPDLAVQADEVLDGSPLLCYPGLINTHHHLYQQFSRNLPEVQNLELFPWLKALYEIWKNLDTEVVRYSSLTGMGELMKNGCTTCFDHHYVFPAGCGDLLGAQFAAADELGMRMVASHDPSYGSMRQIALAPCSPFSVSRELLLQSAKLARQYHVRLHTHLAETKDEECYTLDRYGLRPLAYLESLGWVGPDVWFAHGIHFTDAELDLLAETETGVAHCPVSNMKLSSGVAHIPEMLQRGIHVGLAVDGSASQDGSDLLEEIRICYLLHRLHSSAAAPSGYDVLKLATRGSASLLGREDIGCLAVGKCADLFLVDSRRLELVGACYDPKNVFGTVGLRAPVDYTVVNGRITVAHGKLTGVDEAKTAENARRVCDRYLGKN